MRHPGGGLHGGRPGAVEHDLDDGAGSGRGLRGGRAGRGRHRRDHRLRGEPEPGGVRHGGGGLCDRRRERDRGRGLHGAEGRADLRSGRDGEDGARAGAGRRDRRGRGDLHAAAHERLWRADRRRDRDGHDRELGPVAEDVAVALRAHGGEPGGGRGGGPPVGTCAGLAGDAGRSEHRPVVAVGRRRGCPAHARRGARRGGGG